MLQFNKFRNTRGWLSLWENTLRLRCMKNQQEVERRVKILTFWKSYGDQAAKDAFGTSRRTLYRWQAALTKSKGNLASLDPGSRAPHRRRKRHIPEPVAAFIIKERNAHPGLGKKKLTPLLNEAGYAVSEPYIGRCIADLKQQGRLPSGRKLSFYAKTDTFREKPLKKRKKKRRTAKRGMELDTVVRFVDGAKRYILTAIDTKKKFAFAGAYTSHSSQAAADFLQKLNFVCPLPIQELQTDNGSEFAKEFEQACSKLHITHFHTYPRSPKMNAAIERFNRTISDDFISRNRALLRDDLPDFNEKLADWLIWYNTIRPHETLGNISPLRYITSTLTKQECQMWWTRTGY